MVCWICRMRVQIQSKKRVLDHAEFMKPFFFFKKPSCDIEKLLKTMQNFYEAFFFQKTKL